MNQTSNQPADAGPDFSGRRAIVFDTECTGLVEPSVVEYAFLELDQDAHVSGFFLMDALKRETARFPMGGMLCKPMKPMELGALATHHIIPAMYEGIETVFNYEEHVGLDTVMIGHSIDFDWIAAGRPDVPRICTLAIARRLWPDLDSHSLSAIVYHVLGATAETAEMLQGAHRAPADVMNTCTVFHVMLKMLPHIKSWKALWEYSEDARLPRKWTFGKWEGQPIGTEDAGYRRWFHGACTDREDYEFYAKAFELQKQGLLTP